jgi:hypothetical protein
MFTLQEFVNKTRELVELSPDNRYTGNYSYSAGANDNGSVGCIFGQVLAAFGIEPATVSAIANTRNIHYVLTDSSLQSHIADKDNEQWPAVFNWANALQGQQDSAEPWKDALAFANRRHPLPAGV